MDMALDTGITILFDQYIQPLEPIATGTAPKTPVLPGIKACLFDIYGTLLVSGSGDVGTVNPEQKEALFHRAFADEGIDADSEVSLAGLFRQLIEDDHAAKRRAGISHPEVEIREIWSRLCTRLVDTRRLDKVPAEKTIERLSLRYELLSNPVYPMPGAADVLPGLTDRGCVTGVVSNAQFYTPLLLQYFFRQPVDQLFSGGYFSWSWRQGRSKPDTALFTSLLENLRAAKISAEECLYIGNDMLNDVWTAAACGMRTALFAGDRRSLRLRENKAECRDLVPDAVITDLTDIYMVLNGR